MTKEWTISVEEETWNSNEFFATKEEAIQLVRVILNNFLMKLDGESLLTIK